MISKKALAAAALLAGCSYAELSAGGSGVTVVSSKPDHQCKSLGHVQGKGGGGGGGMVANEDLIVYATNDLRNKAAEMGANYVISHGPTMGTTEGTTTSAMVMGEAFHCDTQAAAAANAAPVAAPAAPESAGCSHDAQCKGERICVEHQCVNPPPSSGGLTLPSAADGSPDAGSAIPDASTPASPAAR